MMRKGVSVDVNNCLGGDNVTLERIILGGGVGSNGTVKKGILESPNRNPL
jgi:hypothetical protein